MTMVLTQELEFPERQVKRLMKGLEKRSMIKIENLVYYPYYFFEFDVSVKTVVGLKGKTACTVDALDGKCALVDVFPQLIQYEIETDFQLEIVITENEARKTAKYFISENISKKVKFLKVPEIKFSSETLYYRPFWLISLTKYKEQSLIIVDAISGNYHPL